MKRDMDLIRDILLRIEEQADGKSTVNMEFEGRPESEVMYQAKLLSDAGFIEAYDASSIQEYYYQPTALTWEGHEFLDAARNQTVWENTKEIAKEFGSSVPLEVLKSLLIKTASAFFGLDK